jgi:hypothetical protein
MIKSTHYFAVGTLKAGLSLVTLVMVSACGLLGGGGGGTTPTPAGAVGGPTKAAATSASPATAGESPVAMLGELTQKVFVVPPGGAQHAGTYGEPIAIGDDLFTDETGRVRVIFSSGSTVRLAPNTRLTLTDHKSNATDDWLTRLNLAIGQVWAIVPTGSLSVETPIGVGAVRGSFISVIYIPGAPDTFDDDILIILCLEGDCTATTRLGEMQFGIGQKVIITGDGVLPAGPVSMDQADVDEWLANNPEILILFRGSTLAPGPDALATITAQVGPDLLTGGGFVVAFPILLTSTPTETPTPTPTPTPTATPTNPPPAPGPSATPCVPSTIPCP